MVYHSSWHQSVNREVLCAAGHVVGEYSTSWKIEQAFCRECRTYLDVTWAPCPWCGGFDPVLGPEAEVVASYTDT